MQIEQAPSVSLWNENKSITQTNTFYKRCKQYKYGDHYIHNVLNRQAVFVAASKDNCIGRVFPCENSKTDPRIYIQIFFFLDIIQKQVIKEYPGIHKTHAPTKI